jgi:hypothetical protein
MATHEHGLTTDPVDRSRDWLVLLAPLAVAIVHLGALVVVPDDRSLGALVPLAVATVAILAGSEYWRTRSLRTALAVAVTVAGGLVLTGALLWNWSLPAAVLAVLGLFATLSYGLHRGALLVLGLVGGEP